MIKFIVYWSLRALIPLTFRAYFKRVYFANHEKIPPKKPVIFACNHPNAFLDAILFAALVKREIFPFARSDVFNTPVKRYLLSFVNLNPIYRLEEGKETLSRNEETFRLAQNVLEKNKAV
ncbi:MAG: 1-acyl-sn-glycerol-3-phosphate acyltransferase, partial [Bacteroidia bacterium]|nr:1-acyl-sn-glycerol-3-phosphate acyltransferase [Bacteroidia bacterium]